MPSLLRPTAPIAPDAILVGDPGRALLLAQELLEQPKMSNHARGLWGYHGSDADGRALTVQSTGVGGPSAALVLADLAGLGVRRAIRVGTCLGVDPELSLGDVLLVGEAIAAGGSSSAFGAELGATVRPDPELNQRLADELEGGEGRRVAIASVDAHPEEAAPPPGASAVDMQTAPLLARAGSVGIAAAAIVIVTVQADDPAGLEKDELEEREKVAGRAAAGVLSG